jgi:hypothetical protein
MKTMKGVCWIALLAMLALPAMAGTVNMQYTGLPTGNNYGGVATYPYNISVNGGPNQWMMCIGYNEHIEGWETWRADVASVGSLDPLTRRTDYEAAFLFEIAVAQQGTDPNVNAAVWYLLEGVPGLTPEAAALVQLAQNQTFTQGEYGNVLLYSAIPGTEDSNLGTAQDFLASTPEPGTLMMFGSGMIGLAGVLRRKLWV